MANASRFRPVSWNVGDMADIDKLENMTSNDQYLFDRMPTAIYRGYGIRQSEGIKIVAGTIRFNPSKKGFNSKQVNLNGLFLGGANPIITTQVISAKHFRVTTTVHGISKLIPDSRGFIIEIYNNPNDPKNVAFSNTVYVNYIAICP